MDYRKCMSFDSESEDDDMMTEEKLIYNPDNYAFMNSPDPAPVI